MDFKTPDDFFYNFDNFFAFITVCKEIHLMIEEKRLYGALNFAQSKRSKKGGRFLDQKGPR